jgi:hypothetical protein
MTKKRRLAWIAATPVVLGTVATAVGLAFDLFPSIRPEAPCDEAKGGELSDVIVDESVSRGAYFEVTGASTTGIPADRLDDAGKLVHFDFRAEGFREQLLPVRTFVLTAGGEPLRGPELSNQLAMELEPEECLDRGRRTIWARTPERPGRFLVEVRLLDPDEELLDTARTEAFRVPAR